jgi:REP element-mobilizing transposase RayT
MKNKNNFNHHQYKGYYFITLTTKNKKDYFGKIEKDRVVLNRRGEIAKMNWAGISAKFSDVSLDEFIIMPNHVHAIMIFKVKAAKSKNEEKLNQILENFKRCTRLDINQTFPRAKKFEWQKSTEVREIHNEGELFDMRYYIDSNPIRWDMDPENLMRGLKAKTVQER